MANEIVVRQSLTPDVWNMIQQIAPSMKDSRYFGIATIPQAVVTMIKGHELGLGLAASFEFIQVIQDRPGLIPRGALALVLSSPEFSEMKFDEKRDDKGNPVSCVGYAKRKNGFSYTVEFTMDDALRADLIKSGSGWAKYPANMLRWRVTGFLLDMVFPDVCGGLKTLDQYGADLTPDGNVIDTTWTQTPTTARVTDVTTPITQAAQPTMPTAAPVAPAAVDPSILLNELVQKFGAEKVLVANEGKIPATLDDLQATREKLEKAGA